MLAFYQVFVLAAQGNVRPLIRRRQQRLIQAYFLRILPAGFRFGNLRPGNLPHGGFEVARTPGDLDAHSAVDAGSHRERDIRIVRVQVLFSEDPLRIANRHANRAADRGEIARRNGDAIQQTRAKLVARAFGTVAGREVHPSGQAAEYQDESRKNPRHPIMVLTSFSVAVPQS